jgi:hypothetical protein
MGKKTVGGSSLLAAGVATLMALLPAVAGAEEAVLDSGDTAWMLTATALVLFMTLPGPGAVLRGHGAFEETCCR